MRVGTAEETGFFGQTATVVGVLLSVTFACGLLIAVAHVVNQRFVAPVYDVVANLSAFGCAVGASILLGHAIPAGLSGVAILCWLVLARRTLLERRQRHTAIRNLARLASPDVGDSREPVPFEVYAPGVYLHGTKADLSVGELLVSGRESNFQQGRTMNYVYFTATLDAATWGAELAAGEGSGRIYVVEPTGEFEDDPNVTDKRFPGNPTQSFRSRHPLRVVGELLDWVGHSPEKLQSMRAAVEQHRGRIED